MRRKRIEEEGKGGEEKLSPFFFSPTPTRCLARSLSPEVSHAATAPPSLPSLPSFPVPPVSSAFDLDPFSSLPNKKNRRKHRGRPPAPPPPRPPPKRPQRRLAKVAPGKLALAPAIQRVQGRALLRPLQVLGFQDRRQARRRKRMPLLERLQTGGQRQGREELRPGRGVCQRQLARSLRERVHGKVRKALFQFFETLISQCLFSQLVSHTKKEIENSKTHKNKNRYP